MTYTRIAFIENINLQNKHIIILLVFRNGVLKIIIENTGNYYYHINILRFESIFLVITVITFHEIL